MTCLSAFGNEKVPPNISQCHNRSVLCEQGKYKLTNNPVKHKNG